jgi:hypothetical protein
MFRRKNKNTNWSASSTGGSGQTWNSQIGGFEHPVSNNWANTVPNDVYNQAYPGYNQASYDQGFYPNSTSRGDTYVPQRRVQTFSTPFGTPGFASENLLADNPWTHDTLGYDYYDYFADQRVRGPFGVAPGSLMGPGYYGPNVIPPQGYAEPQRKRHFWNRRHPEAPAAAFATLGGPVSTGPILAHNERMLPDGTIERIDTETIQTFVQDPLPANRILNTNLPSNIPATSSSTTTSVVQEKIVDSNSTRGTPITINETVVTHPVNPVFVPESQWQNRNTTWPSTNLATQGTGLNKVSNVNTTTTTATPTTALTETKIEQTTTSNPSNARAI